MMAQVTPPIVPTAKFICPMLSTTIWANPMVIGTARYVRKPCNEARLRNTPFEVTTSARKPSTKITVNETSVIRFLKNDGSFIFST